MNIKNKYKIGEDVYLGDELHKVYKISQNLYGAIEYRLIKYNGQFPDWYDEWQISRTKNNIGFKHGGEEEK